MINFNLKVQSSKFRHSGQSMFEVVLAIAVIGMIVVGVVVLATNAVRNTTFSRNQTLASRYAQEAMEWLRDQRNTDPTNFRSRVNANNNYCLDNLSWSNGGTCGTNEIIGSTPFKRQVTFGTTSEDNTQGDDVIIINTVVTVTWNDSQGLHEVRSSTDLTDLREL